MRNDVVAVVRKEWILFFRQDDSRFSGALRVGIMALLGVTLAQTLGPEIGRSWLTPALAAFLSAVFVLPVVAASFAGEREHHTLESLLATRVSERGLLMGKLSAITLYGWAIAVAVLAVAVGAAVARGGPVAADVLASSVGAAFLAAALTASAGVLISLHSPTVTQATQTLGIVLVSLTALPMLVGEMIPPDVLAPYAHLLPSRPTPGLIVLGVLQVLVVLMVLIAVAHSRFRRDRLVAD